MNKQRESFADGIIKPSTRPTANIPDTWEEDPTDDNQAKLLTNLVTNELTNNIDNNSTNGTPNKPTYTEKDVLKWQAEARYLADPDEHALEQVGHRVAEPLVRWFDARVSENNANVRRGRKISRQDIVVYGLRLAYVEIMKNGGVFKKNMDDDRE